EEGAETAANGDRVTTAVWAPPRPTRVLPVDFAHLDEFEVRIISDEEGPRLKAVIELVSPANKDRRSHRRACAIKCASYLQHGVALVLVDIVTTRSGNLHADLMGLLELPAEGPGCGTDDLYVVACRTVAPTESEVQLETWQERLALGAVL